MKTESFFFYILGVHLPLLIIPSLPSPSEVIIFWLHYICSHPTAGSLLIKILKLSKGKDRSACGGETSRKAWPWQKGCWGPVCVTASLSHGHAQPLVFLGRCNEPSQVSPTDGVETRVGGSIFDKTCICCKMQCHSCCLPCRCLQSGIELRKLSLQEWGQ